jgi:hypothetical protein
MTDLLKELAEKHDKMMAKPLPPPFTWEDALLAFGRELLEKMAAWMDSEADGLGEDGFSDQASQTRHLARRLRSTAKGGQA